MSYLDAVGKISWGYFFIYISINLGTIDILPSWLGFLLIFMALDGVASLETSAKLIKPFALILMAEAGAEWGLKICSVTLDLYWIGTLTGVISLYFHFQLLTNLAQIAEGQGSKYAGSLKKLRTLQTIFFTIMVLVPVSSRMTISLVESSLFIIALALANIPVMLLICITLFSYKKELEGMEGERLTLTQSNK